MCYKHFFEHSATGTTEIELKIDDMGRAEALFLAMGLRIIRRLEKKRHDFLLDGCKISIDEWPQQEPYLEIEGPSEEALQATAALLDLDWNDAYFKNGLWLLLEKRGLQTEWLMTYTFEKIEYADGE